MRAWVMAAVAAVGMGVAGMAFAQRNPTAERRAGLRQMNAHLEAIAAIVQGSATSGRSPAGWTR